MIKYQDFEIELSPGQLLSIMHHYDLKAEDVIGNYRFDPLRLNGPSIAHELNKPDDALSSALANSISAISRWPKQLGWPQFNLQIHHLLSSWIEDYKASTALEHGLILSRCLNMEVPADKLSQDPSLSFKFQSLLAHLIARTTNQFDQYRYQYSLNFDVETNLPNRYLLLNILKRQLKRMHDSEKHLGLILLNLNIDFREQPQLDAISTELALAAIDTIHRHLNENSTLFQIETGEFAVLVNDLKTPTQLNFIASQLTHAFESALPLDNITIILKPHMGGVSTFKATPNAMGLMDCARLALHHALIHNHQIEIYDPITTSAIANSASLEEAVIRALQENELELFLQPIVSICDNPGQADMCSGAELLLRWRNKDWPTISPIQLIDIIYKKGFGKVFIRWLINNASRLCAELKNRFHQEISLTVNLCASDLLDIDLPELIVQAIRLWDISAENLVIEMTESDLLLDESKANLVIEKIVSLGCKLALDDFGTGYSSMSRLRRMPIDLVKIDQSFVRNIGSSKEDRAVVQSILQLAHSLEKQVIAEGVEDIATVNFLKALQCEKIQGYYYAKPMPFVDFCSWMDNFKTGQLYLSA
jgi:EAL domain-containing protein (putative c-di-GMP-specific phosphodiesterase class I)/GGDEF domain-containing protein